MKIRIATVFFTVLFSHSANSQITTMKYTAPGQVLLDDCKKVNENDPSAYAIVQRASCLRFIESALMSDRHKIAEQSERFKQWIAGKGPATSWPISFCYPYSTEWGISMLEVSVVSKQLMTYLQAQPAIKLDRLNNADDTQMRLLMDFLKAQYPCPK